MRKKFTAKTIEHLPIPSIVSVNIWDELIARFFCSARTSKVKLTIDFFKANKYANKKQKRRFLIFNVRLN